MYEADVVLDTFVLRIGGNAVQKGFPSIRLSGLLLEVLKLEDAIEAEIRLFEPQRIGVERGFVLYLFVVQVQVELSDEIVSTSQLWEVPDHLLRSSSELIARALLLLWQSFFFASFTQGCLIVPLNRLCFTTIGGA